MPPQACEQESTLLELKQMLFDELQPMVQQSQLLKKAMFLQPDHTYFLSSPLLELQSKTVLTPDSEQESKLAVPPLAKKLTKKSISKETHKSKRQKLLEQANASQKFGHWTSQENKRYHWFLEIHNQHFLNKHMRRTDKIFKSMALFVGSREAEQCRSHHQKMEKKHRSFRNILCSLRNEHNGSQGEELVIQDLRENGVAVIDTILAGRFLGNYEEHGAGASELIEGERPSEDSSQHRMQQRKQQLANWMQREEFEQVRLLPMRMDCFQRDVIELLLADQAPHNNYSMI